MEYHRLCRAIRLSSLDLANTGLASYFLLFQIMISRSTCIHIRTHCVSLTIVLPNIFNYATQIEACMHKWIQTQLAIEKLRQRFKVYRDSLHLFHQKKMRKDLSRVLNTLLSWFASFKTLCTLCESLVTILNWLRHHLAEVNNTWSLWSLLKYFEKERISQKYRLHSENSSLGFIEVVHRW